MSESAAEEKSSGKCPTLKLAGTGDEMPVVGYGTWLSEPGQVYTGTKHAIKSGYRHIDEAWIYSNETEVGKAIKECLEEGVLKSRSELWVTSKLWNCFHRPELVREACLESLGKLGLKQLDLFLIHFPVSFVPGCSEAVRKDQTENIPLADTWLAMEKLVDEGLVRNIGVSNFEIDEIKAVEAVASKPIAVNQYETHPYYQRRELTEYCHSKGIVVTAHSSLGGAANAMSKFHKSPPLKDDPAVLKVAAKHGTTPQAVLLSWALSRSPPTIVIPKSVTPSRIEANLAVTLSLKLDAGDMAAINALNKPGLDGCFCHPKTPWLGRSEFSGSTDHYYG